jgi:hypothetical protein
LGFIFKAHQTNMKWFVQSGFVLCKLIEKVEKNATAGIIRKRFE